MKPSVLLILWNYKQEKIKVVIHSNKKKKSIFWSYLLFFPYKLALVQLVFSRLVNGCYVASKQRNGPNLNILINYHFNYFNSL